MADFLVLDVGGAALAVEIVTSGAVKRRDSSGISKRRAFGGALLVSVAYREKIILTGFSSKWMTTNEFAALVAAAKFPQTIVVSGACLRTDNADTTPVLLNAVVEVTEADYVDDGNEDFLHQAKIVVEQAD